MHRSGRIDVMKRQRVFVFKHRFVRNFATQDFGKDVFGIVVEFHNRPQSTNR